MASTHTESDLSEFLWKINKDDPAEMYRIQRYVRTVCDKFTENDDEDFNQEDAEKFSRLIVHCDVWPSVMFSVPSLRVKTSVPRYQVEGRANIRNRSQVPNEGGGARDFLQRTLKEAGCLENDEPEPDHREKALRNRLEFRL